MSDWKRVEDPVTGADTPSPASDAAAETTQPDRQTEHDGVVDRKPRHAARKDPATLPAPTEGMERPDPDDIDSPGITGEAEAQPPIRSDRYTKSGRRKGRRRYAAPLGLLVLLLAATGVISLVVLGVNMIRKAQDDTPLRNELYDFLSPVMQYTPPAFTDVNDTKNEQLSDVLISSAIWQLTWKENIRQTQQHIAGKDETSIYPLDDESRMMIPVAEIEKVYHALFGPKAVPKHHTIGEEDSYFAYLYDEKNGCYHVSAVDPSTSPSMYEPVFDTVKQKGDTVTIRVGYVLKNTIGIDDKGNTIPVTPAMAEKFQIYTVKKTDTGWRLLSVADETTQ